MVRKKSSSSRKCFFEYSGGLASACACGSPAANSSSMAVWTFSVSAPSFSARPCTVRLSDPGSSTRSLRLPKAIEWSSTRTRPSAPISASSSSSTEPRRLASRASVLNASSRAPLARIFSNSGSILESAARRSRCTTHRLMPCSARRCAVASPKPLEPPRITAHWWGEKAIAFLQRRAGS